MLIIASAVSLCRKVYLSTYICRDTGMHQHI